MDPLCFKGKSSQPLSDLKSLSHFWELLLAEMYCQVRFLSISVWKPHLARLFPSKELPENGETGSLHLLKWEVSRYFFVPSLVELCWSKSLFRLANDGANGGFGGKGVSLWTSRPLWSSRRVFPLYSLHSLIPMPRAHNGQPGTSWGLPSMCERQRSRVPPCPPTLIRIISFSRLEVSKCIKMWTRPCLPWSAY